MKNPVVDLVEKELIWFQQEWASDRVREADRQIFPNKNNLYPIPFFGDIRRAEVLTVALNPAHDEFDERQWPIHQTPTALNGSALANRLLHYFDLPEPQPHRFFQAFSQMLMPIHVSYARNAAHVDLSSLPTLKPREMIGRQRPVFIERISTFAPRLNEVLCLARRAKLLLVLDFHVGNGAGGQVSIWEMLCQHCPRVAAYADTNGIALPVLKKRNKEEMTELVSSMRYEIREHLTSGLPL